MTIRQTEIRLDGLRFYARHGVMKQEQRTGGTFVVTLRMWVDRTEEAVMHDRLTATVNYAEAYELVRKEMEQPSKLIEHVAGRILMAVFARFPQVIEAQVEVQKVNPPMGADCEGATACVRAMR